MSLPEKSIFPDTLMGYFGLHEIILYFVIALLISALGGGPLLRAAFTALLKLFGHGTAEMVVNIEQGGEMSGKLRECKQCGLMVDPAMCPLHAAEAKQSERNKEDIASLTRDLKENTGKLWNKLDGMDTTLSDIKVAVAKLVVERNYQMEEQDTKKRRGT